MNSFPDRLDLKDEHILWARRYGPKFAVNTDSHSPVHLSLMRFGVATAQRGWLTKDDVINTWPLAKLRSGSCARGDPPEPRPPVRAAAPTELLRPRRSSQVAPDLLGRILVRAFGGRHRGSSARIVETEAYEPGDPASHAYSGRDGAERRDVRAHRAICTCTSRTACISA